MDLRKFFGGSSSQGSKGGTHKSTLSEIKAKVTSNEKSPVKKRMDRKKVPAVDIDNEDSDESPLPSSILRMNKSRSKRQRVILSSDSEDNMPVVVKKKNSPRKESSRADSISPIKKKSRVVRDSSDSPSPIKTKKKKEISPVREESDDEVMLTDSEDEFKEKPKKKKDVLLKGQNKLTFAPSTDRKNESVPTKKVVGKAMDPSTFFGGSSSSKVTVEKETTVSNKEKVTVEKETTVSNKEKVREEKSVLSDRSNDKNKKIGDVMDKRTSPRKQKTPPKEKDEFEESDEGEPIHSKNDKKRTIIEDSKKKKNIPSPKKIKSDPPKTTAHTELSKTISKSQPIAESKIIKEDDSGFIPWVDKYKPTSLQHLVGQNGDKAPMKKLSSWLSGWKTWHLGEGAKIKRPKPPPGWETDGSPFKAILLSGPPGIGKTTCAHLACQLQGFNVIEMNASDVRNKKHLEAQVAQLTGCHQMDEYFGKGAKEDHDNKVVHHVLIMDEVDGMSGNEDRAGIAELIAIIKDTRIPIICICNDRSHPKMRTLSNHTYDVRFPRPQATMLLSRVMTIANRENMKISKEEAMELIEQSGHDVRQTIYNLQMRSIGGTQKGNNIEQKDFAINTFEAARRLLNQSSSLADRQQMFFVDYGIMPLFVQESYPLLKKTDRSKPNRNELACLRKASDLLAWGDTIEKTIRSGGSWKLLNEQSMLSAALPTIAMDGQIKSMITFPSWLGKNSTAGKRQRLMRQVEYHAHLKISASPSSLVMDYVPVLRDRLTRPLIEKDAAGVPDVIATMIEYDLLKDDADAIGELAVWPGQKDPAEKIQSKVKAALTRTLNKTSRILPYQLDDVSKGKRKGGGIDDNVEMDEFGNLIEKKNDEDALEEDDDDEDEEKPMKPTTTKTSTSTRGGRGGTRGGGGRGRGKK